MVAKVGVYNSIDLDTNFLIEFNLNQLFAEYLTLFVCFVSKLPIKSRMIHERKFSVTFFVQKPGCLEVHQ